MAGGRKHSKKRRKKNWRTVLEGCFNKNPFTSSSQRVREDQSARDDDSPEREAKSTVTDSEARGGRPLLTTPTRCLDDSPRSSRADEAPIRGILKKSNTTASIASAIYAEAAVDVPNALLHSLRPKSEISRPKSENLQERPAYLQRSEDSKTRPLFQNGYSAPTEGRNSRCQDYGQMQHSWHSGSDSRALVPYSSHGGLVVGRTRPNSYHEGDFRAIRAVSPEENVYSTPDVDVRHRPMSVSDRDHYQHVDQPYGSNYVEYKLYDLTGKTRYRQNDQLQNGSVSERPVYSEPTARRYELDQAFDHSLDSSTSPSQQTLFRPTSAQRNPYDSSTDPGPVYVQLDEIQQRKAKQRSILREKNIPKGRGSNSSSPKHRKFRSGDDGHIRKPFPPTSWHGSAILACASAPPSRRKLLPMLECKPQLPPTPNTTPDVVRKQKPNKTPSSSSPSWQRINSEVEVYDIDSSRCAGQPSPARNYTPDASQRSRSRSIERGRHTRRERAPTRHDSHSRRKDSPSRYVTNALPRSRDPIRKPMGSWHYPSPDNPLTRALPPSVRDWSPTRAGLVTGYDHISASAHYDHKAAVQAASSFMATETTATIPARKYNNRYVQRNQPVEVSSEIYATVTRSSKSQTPDGTAYIYTSCVSWKKRMNRPPNRGGRIADVDSRYHYNYTDDDDDDDDDEEDYDSCHKWERVSRTPSSSRRHAASSLPHQQSWYASSTSIANTNHGFRAGIPASASVVGRHCSMAVGRSNDHKLTRRGSRSRRPPLPSYDEIIESRRRFDGARPVSWCGYTNGQKSEQERDAAMQYLAKCYPEYAKRIQGASLSVTPPDRTASSSSSASPSPQPETDKPMRARDVQRRRTAMVTYDPTHSAQTLEYDDLGTMSDLELPSFQRGGFMRTSLPMPRCASTSLERPLGLVFLVSGDQTKKAMLPNEITALDTVRALFVRAFPDLTLEMLESPRRKIYILDPATNIYFQLEDLAEIKDRSVLKLHETDSIEPQRVKERQEVRGRTVQMPQSRPQSRPNPLYDTLPGGPDGPGPPHHYPQDHWDPADRRSRSRTPEPAERPRSLSAGAQSRQRISHSPEHMGTPSNPLNPIPENRQFLAQHNPGYRREGHHHPHHQMPLPVAPPPPPPRYYDPADTAVYGVVGPGSVTGSHYAPLPVSQTGMYETYTVPPALAAAQQQQTYVARSMRAPPLAHPQRAVAPGLDYRDGLRGSSVKQSPPYSSSDSSGGIYQQRPLPQTPADGAARDRMEKMEQQLASLEAWVHKREAEKTVESKGGLGPRRDMPPPPSSIQKQHQPKAISSLPSTASGSSETFPDSTSSSISDVSGGHHRHALGHGSSASSVSRSDTSTPVPSMGSAVEARARLAELRADLHVLRRQQQLNMEVVRDEISGAWTKLQKVIGSVPGAESKVLVHKRSMITLSKNSYLSDKDQVDQELSDLEASVEEQRNDVISRRCRVNIADVEGMALLLSNITKSLADLKARFPELQSQMKDVMDAEMRIVVAEEKFLKGEPTEIEKSLKRCKNLTQTLFTLKRLASAQDLQPPHIPNVAHGAVVAEEDQLTDQKHAVLESINALIPDHQQRVEHIEAAEASRERKKKISTQKEALKFGKSLEAATKQLRPPPEQSQGSRDIMQEAYNMAECDKKPPSLPAKPPLAAKPLTAPTSLPPSISSESSTATHVTRYANQMAMSTPSSSSPSTKSAFTAALTTTASTSGRVAEKPTATVSAMTAHVSDSITATAAKTARPDRLSSASEAGLVSSEKQQQSGMGSTVSSGMGAVTQTVYRVQTPVSQRGDVDISTYQVCGPVNPMIPSSQAGPSRPNDPPPTVGSHVNLYGSPPGGAVTMGGKDSFEKPRSVVNGTGHNPSESLPSLSPPSSLASTVEGSSSVAKKPSVTFAEAISTIPSSPSLNSPPHTSYNNDHNNTSSLGDQICSEPHQGLDKPDLATQKQAARSAFFSSLNSPPSPSSKDSATLDPGPLVSPGLVGKVTPGSTINLVLAGTASPKSPTHPGTFTIQPPADIRQRRVSDSCQVDISSSHPQTIIHSSASPKKTPPPTLVPPRQSSLDFQLPPHGPAPLASVETSSSSSEGDYAGAKPKKVPPPPPPRKGSRPTSVSGYPGFPSSMSPSHTNSAEAPPRFVGGVLGQHRLSGGPLSSTPKSGNYVDASAAPKQGQPLSTFQQLPMDSERNSNKATNGNVVNGSNSNTRVEAADMDGRQERGSSSESTGSSGNSGHSIVSVVRAQSVHSTPGRHGTKPAPPKRQSSLLAKFTGK